MIRSRDVSILLVVLVGIGIGSGFETEVRAAEVRVNEKEVCLACHDLTDGSPPKITHAPVENGECSSCHNPHVARFGGLLRERPASLCISCH